MTKKLLGILMILGLAFAIAACGNNDDDKDTANNDTDTNKTTTANAGDAAKLFDQKCSSCHGKNLEGAMGPNLTQVGSRYSKDEILDIIKNGKSGGMPAGQLAGDDADAVATWLSKKK